MKLSLFQADSLDIMRGLKKHSVDLIVTDPPYEVNVRGGILTGIGKNWKSAYNYFEPIKDFRPYFKEMVRILKPDAHCYVFTSRESHYELLSLGMMFFQVVEYIPLIKANCYPVSQYWLRNTELVIMFQKGRRVCNDQSQKNVLYGNRVINEIHPTEKPVNALGTLIKMSSDEGEVVLDPFMGGGSTGVAAVKLKRYFIGVEKYAKWYEPAVEKIKEEFHPTRQMRLL